MHLELDFKKYSSALFGEIEKFATSTSADDQITSVVSEILQDIKNNGDQALLERTLLYDKAHLNKSDLRISIDEINQASASLSEAQRTAIEEAIANVTYFHEQNLPKNWESTNSHGALIGENYYPIRRVGLYLSLIHI